MLLRRLPHIGCLFAFLVVGVTSRVAAEPPAASEEWPQFHGPRRDNRSTETGLLQRWPEGGPTLLWQASGLGEGWATVAISGGKIYTAGNIDADTVITAMDLTGKRLWQAKNGPAYDRQFPGARSTPTVAAGKLYHLNGDGDVICLDAPTGRRLWQLSMAKEFQGRNPQWGLAESLLVDGPRVICCPGGPEVGMVALDKDTGKTVWTCTGIGDKPAYASPILVEYGGLRQIVTMTAASVVGVAADTGKLLWKYDHPASYDVNVSTLISQDGQLAFCGTWGRGTTKLKLHVAGDRCTVERLWHTKELDNEHGGVVLVDGYLYGLADGNHRNRHWACLAWDTGETQYATKGLEGPRSATLTYAEGMLYLVNERGTVALLPARPDGFELVSQFKLPKQGDGPTWAHPVVCGGRLYIRHGQYLYAYDVRRSAEAK
ncbi:MAG: PQQ-binding-like beta-propeller repeat protein [Thermoguttaceae bacterium]